MTKQKKNSKGRLNRERRLRIDALHRSYDNQNDLSLDDFLKQLEPISLVRNLPFTLANAIIDECKRHGGGKIHPALAGQAAMLASQFAEKEPNPKVRAAWAVERTEMEMAYSLPFDHWCPNVFINGHGHTEQLDPRILTKRVLIKKKWSGLHKKDLWALKSLTPMLHEGVVTADWTPQYPTRLWDSDPIRPPAEVLALIAKEFRSGLINILSI